MANVITTLGNRDRILIDDFSIAHDTTFSSEKIRDLIKTFDSVVRCSIALTEPIGAASEYDSTYLTILTGEIGERVLITAPNGLGVVIAESGTVYTIKTVYLCTWETLTGKPFETLRTEDFTVDNGTLGYVDKWTGPINDLDGRKQDKVPELGAGQGYTQGDTPVINGVQIRIDAVNASGGITAVSLAAPDTEYPDDPAGTFAVPGGTGGSAAVASAAGAYKAVSVTVDNPGQDYTQGDTPVISGVQIRIDAVDVSGGITAVSLAAPDTEYPDDPAGTFAVPGGTGGSAAVASAVSAYKAVSVTLFSGGTGRYVGKRDALTGDAAWEEMDEFSLVNSVNGVFPENMPAGKNVQLDGTKINLDDTAGNPVTVKNAVINIAELAEAAVADNAGSNALPVTGLIKTVLQTTRDCLKWLVQRFNASGVLPTANGGTGRTDGKAFMPAGIIVFTASNNPGAQRLVPLEGQTLTNAYVAGNAYYDLAQCFPSTTGGFVKSGNNLVLPNYRGLFLRGSGSQSITEYGFSGAHNGGNIGEKHGDAVRNISAGYFYAETQYSSSNLFGALGKVSETGYIGSSGTDYDNSGVTFQASRVVPTDATNHPAFGVGRICITY